MGFGHRSCVVHESVDDFSAFSTNNRSNQQEHQKGILTTILIIIGVPEILSFSNILSMNLLDSK